MNKAEVIGRIEEFARQNIRSHDGGHDWWHLNRVRNISLHICTNEAKGDPLVVEIASLLHDIGDKKFRKDGEDDHLTKIGQLLYNLDLEKELADKVLFINENISFSRGKRSPQISMEFMIVQDADRIDAIGAIGIARAFNYGGFINNPIWDPSGLQPSTIAHFYEKLLKLRDMMNTETGRKIAGERHRYLESFLEKFYSEWRSGESTGV